MMDQWLNCHQQLLDGNYDDNWPQHEWIRTGNPAFKDRYEPTPTFGLPVWNGSIEPVVLLINADFGMGDTIHFFRFVAAASRRVSKVILRCDEDFKPLFQGVEVLGKDEPIPSECQKIIHMMALPHVLGVKQAELSGSPYLTPNTDFPMDRDLVSMLTKFSFSKVGLCSQGNPFNPRDSIRSIPGFPEGFESSFTFFGLNKIGQMPRNCLDMRAYMTDWNQTAHLVSLLDLVITIDTAVAHLAGAMGVPTWLILSNEDVDWRWGRDGESCVWYASMKIFRREFDWPEVLKRVSRCMDCI